LPLVEEPLLKRPCPSRDAPSPVTLGVALGTPKSPLSPRRVRFEPSIRYEEAAIITQEEISAVWYSGMELIQIKLESTQLARRLLTENAEARDPWLEHLNQVYGVFLQTKCEKDLQDLVSVLAASSPRNSSSSSLLNEACYGLEKWTIPTLLRETIRRRHFLTKQLHKHQNSDSKEQPPCKLSAADRIRRLSRRTTLPARFMARYLALTVAASTAESEPIQTAVVY
jgi:hypothetical protein